MIRQYVPYKNPRLRESAHTEAAYNEDSLYSQLLYIILLTTDVLFKYQFYQQLMWF